MDAQEGERAVYRCGSSSGLSIPPPRPFQLQVKLAGGIGLSVMNHLPEEILYLSLRGLGLDVEKAGDKLTVVFDLGALQVLVKSYEHVKITDYPRLSITPYFNFIQLFNTFLLISRQILIKLL